MQAEQIAWPWRGETIRIGIDWLGSGPSVLLLPALSSISTRREMRPLQERLSAHYRTAAVDWPGFGDQPRPPLDWNPEAYSAFLSFLLSSVIPHPHAIIAAGHAAAYALKHVAADATATGRLVLIAPTWRGPLPTMMGGHRPFFDRLCRLVDLPGIGPLIYRLNVNQPIVRYMGAGHVYVDRGFLTGERLREKLAVTRATGARFASVRFVTGLLDPLHSRDEFLDLARRIVGPILLVYGAETPPRSRAEMEALAALPNVRSIRLPHGKLAVHEEFPDATVEAIAPFLQEESRAG
jgi:pimeloyl-ACP methyl ester carboxylesterase